MRMLLTISAVLLMGRFVARAQDSPIIINDNGGVPLEDEVKSKKKKAAPKTQQAKPLSKTETHVHYDNGIHAIGGKKPYYYVQDSRYVPVCIDPADGGQKPIYLGDLLQWTLITQAKKDNTTLSGTIGNNLIRIDPGKNMKQRTSNGPDLDDDEAGTANQQLISAVFIAGSSTQSYTYRSVDAPFIIHYCTNNDCTYLGKDYCPDRASHTLQPANPK